MQWPFSNEVSALPHFMSFKVGQEDKIRKPTSETHISSGFGPVSTADAFDQSQKRAMLEFQVCIIICNLELGPKIKLDVKANFLYAVFRSS